MSTAPKSDKPVKLSLAEQIAIAMKVAGRIRTENQHFQTIGRGVPEDQELLDGIGAIIGTLGAVRDNEPAFRKLLEERIKADRKASSGKKAA